MRLLSRLEIVMENLHYDFYAIADGVVSCDSHLFLEFQGILFILQIPHDIGQLNEYSNMVKVMSLKVVLMIEVMMMVL